MTRKTQALYEVALRKVLEVCLQQTGRIPTPARLISDYELAILQALANVFPTGRARGCYFHSGQVGLFTPNIYCILFIISETQKLFLSYRQSTDMRVLWG